MGEHRWNSPWIGWGRVRRGGAIDKFCLDWNACQALILNSVSLLFFLFLIEEGIAFAETEKWIQVEV